MVNIKSMINVIIVVLIARHVTIVILNAQVVYKHKYFKTLIALNVT